VPNSVSRPSGAGPNALRADSQYIEEMYERFQRSPESLPASWQSFFQGFELARCPRACVAAERARSQGLVDSLIHTYRVRGHLLAQLDPLGSAAPGHPDLGLESFAFEAADFDRVFDCGALAGPERATLREIHGLLCDTYCRSMGVEYMHIQDRTIRRWLEERMEPVRNRPVVPQTRRLDILRHLVNAELFERFLQRHYPGQKRFSLEGAETLIPALHAFVELAAELGVAEIVVGMPHRGRLNVLCNILDKSYGAIFAEFEGELAPDRPGGDGDVRYHKGYASEHDGRIRVSLTSNPSHLEAVDPVVEGRARAKQRRLGDAVHRKRVVPLLIHGDAAFSGQGLVAETLNLSQLQGYATGGTVHLVVNNQIGFTATPAEERSSTYPTDVLKMVEAPIFHVNGDDPEVVVHAVELGLRFRQTFGRDVGIDLVCYRRHGHSELDDPAFTQPVLYRRIAEHPTPRAVYTAQLGAAGDLPAEQQAEIEREFNARLQQSLSDMGKAEAQGELDQFRDHWAGLDAPYSDAPVQTGVDYATLLEVAEAAHRVPEGMHLGLKLARQLSKRLEAVRERTSVDWALGEALAFGTLLREGTPVRLSGQDSARGTFSQRHAVWFDSETGEPYTPLNHIHPEQARLCVYNSSLSEGAVLGFDYGYSLVAPEMLVVWEAQFGDFANGAQVIIDQFIVSSEAKWGRTSGLVLLLPHGWEGQGPEHSNAYLERYLAACAENNIQVCNLSTPAQYYHALRRQQRRPFRRPLVVMAPKSLLRNPAAVSPVEELVAGRFHEIFDDPLPPETVERVVLCSGKVYWDLAARREALGHSTAALVRVEQLYPFPERLLGHIIWRYPESAELCWAQEEPQNRGAYRFVRERLGELITGRALGYAGRPASASPATGSMRVHQREQQALLDQALVGANPR
jgi:2-oxoglutarate dehydrogenase E1 component